MKLKDLVKKLQAKPDQDAEVEFLVINKPANTILCCDLTGPATTDLMRVLAKGGSEHANVDAADDTARVDWMEQMRNDSEGHVLTRVFMPTTKTFRESIDAIRALNS